MVILHSKKSSITFTIRLGCWKIKKRKIIDTRPPFAYIITLEYTPRDKDKYIYIMGCIIDVTQRRKKCPNLRTMFAENIWALEVSQKILAENHVLCNSFF